MRILFLEGDMSRRGGTERMTATLANAFCDNNQIWIISLKLENNKIFFTLEGKVENKVLQNYNGQFGVFKQIRDIHVFIKQEKIDWVINVDVGMGFYGILAAKGTKAKVITWEHSNYYNNWGSKLFPYFRIIAAKYSHAMVVLTEQDKRNYEEHINTKKPIYVIPNPVEKREFIYDINSKIILSVGALVPIKRYDRVVKIAKNVLSKHIDWRWIICGEGQERSYIEKMIIEYNLKDKVLLLGNVQDMASIYKNVSMVVMTSYMEGLPMALLEAKSFGLPLVSFDIMTGPRDIIVDSVNGYLIPDKNINEMAEKINVLIENEELRKSFSANSNKNINKFSKEKILNDWNYILYGRN